MLIPQDEVASRLKEQLEHPHFAQEYCEQWPDHVEQIQRLIIENELLKQQLSYEKAKNARLAGELSRFKELARRVLYGDKHPSSWDNRREGLVRLVGGLLGLTLKEEDKKTEAMTDEDGHQMFFSSDDSNNDEDR